MVFPGINEQLLDKRTVIHPGEHTVSKNNIVLSTLLGSCVAACLFDQEEQVVGMNHFLLANERYARRDPPVLESEAGRYGMYAMELLVNDMLKMGAKRKNLRAKVFGGGNVLPGISSDDNFFAVGSVNSRFVVEYLKRENIPIVAKDLNGGHGRVIHFVSSDYSVFVKRIAKAKAIDLGKKEKLYWKRSIEQHERESGQSAVQYW